MKKVVLLGDSIRMLGYGKIVPSLLQNDYYVWQPGENCRFSAYTLRLLYDFRDNIEGADIIYWNNGLWDVEDTFGDGNFTDIDTYVKNMKRIGKILLSYSKNVVFATTTPVKPYHSFAKIEDIKKYNDEIVPILKDMGIIINDLYDIVYRNIDEYIRKDDNIHLTDSGISACAEQVSKCIRENC